MNVGSELETLEAQRLRALPHDLHPAGGLTEDFVYEPIEHGKYVYKTKEDKKAIVVVDIEYEIPDKQEKPHFSIKVEGKSHYFSGKMPKEFLFSLPDSKKIEQWVNGKKVSLSILQLQRLNAVYLRTFLDFPHDFEFSVVQLFVQQTWLSEILPVVFYIGIKGEFGGGKTVTAESVVAICHHGYFTGNLSPPFVARSIESQKLTLLVDELDSIATTKDSDLNSIMRQGYRRGIKYSRVNPDTLETESFDIFGPKLFTVHSDIEEALQTRTIPIHVRETSKTEFPVVNLSKAGFSQQVYAENFLWYLDNILSFRDNETHIINVLASQQLALVDIVDMVDPSHSDITVQSIIEEAENTRKIMYEKTSTLLTASQLCQLSQLAGRNVELMFICFVISNITKTKFDDDLQKTFEQKILEEGERIELGYIGLLREVLSALWKEKQTLSEYKTEAGLIKIGNKEVYDTYNLTLKKEYGEGVSPAKFKEYMLEFGFTDALNRVKLKVPIPGDPEPKSRLCNIFTDRVLRKIGVETESKEDNSLKTKLEQIKTWLIENRDADGLVDFYQLTEKIRTLELQKPTEIIEKLRVDGQVFDVPMLGKLGVR